MKSTAYFTRTILTHLEQRASEDPLFARSFANPGKDIDRCCTYILDQVQQSGCNGFHDDEIFGMAEDFYTTDNIEAGKPVNCHIVVNRMVELSIEEKEQARKEAIERVHNEAYAKMKQPLKRSINKKTEVTNQLSLF
jgi:hypothetical protein